MTDVDLHAIVLRTLVRIAPEIDVAALRGDAPLRDQADLDSMDFLNFVLGLHRELGIEIPESDYGAIATVDGCVNYLRAHVAPARAAPRGPLSP